MTTHHRTGVSRIIFGASGLLMGLGIGLAATIGGCDEQASTPPQSNGGNKIGLAENPTSIPGKSAKAGKNAAQGIENKQAEASGLANEISGQGTNLELVGLSWPVPTAWEKATPASNMVAAEYHVKGDDGEARLTMSTFPSEMSSMNEQNIQRWASQFKDSATQAAPIVNPHAITVSGCKVTQVSIDGTMKGGMPGGPSSDTAGWAMRAAIVEGPKGLVTIKLVGPKSVIEASQADWDTMIQGMTKK